MDFATMLALEPHGPDTFVGAGPAYPWGGLYGGQILAQGLRAAASTVDPGFEVHSLHAYFIRLGDAAEPIRFEVDRLRNGRTFTTRHVVVRQATAAILNMAVSFQVSEAGPEVTAAAVEDMPDPDSLPESCWSPVFERRIVHRYTIPGRSTGWLRIAEPVGPDPVLHNCALAFLSDDLPTEAVIALHPDRPEPGSEEWPFWSASLDHAIWFHRPFQADRWHLHDFRCNGLRGSRGLAIGEIYSSGGDHVATVSQQVLLRNPR